MKAVTRVDMKADMKAEVTAAIESIQDVGRWMDARGWAPATSGNYSVRLADGSIAVTVSGRSKGVLREEDVMVVNRDGEPSDHRRPSAEVALHAVVYRVASTMGAVIHAHTVSTTVLSTLLRDANVIELRGLEMLKALPGIDSHDTCVAVPIVENTQDMSRLARVIEPLLRAEFPVGLLVRGHGIYTWGRTMAEARRCIDALEFMMACQLELRRHA